MEGKFLIKGGQIVSPGGIYAGDILVEDGRIAALFRAGKGCEGLSSLSSIDARGKYIIPGCVDPHTHMMDPGYPDREDFIQGTKAAAYGGTTTIITHHRSNPPVYAVARLKEKIEYLNQRAVVDFALKGGGAPDNIGELEAMWEAGVTGFKMFTCNLHGVKAMLPGFLYESFKEIARLNAVVLIHCEEDNILTVNEKRLKEAGRTDYLSQLEWRSALAEKVAVENVITVARETGARVVIAHVSQPELLQKIKAARDEGYPIYAESCPHYFNLTVEDLQEKGPWVKFTPPVKPAENLEAMWECFNRDLVTMIGSDHCPFPKEVKKPGEKNIWDAPNGIPGVETSLRLMLNGVNQGRTTLEKVVRTMSEQPARIYGLYPRKGVIQPGSDADLVILDMEKEEVLLNEKVVSKCGWTPYHGKRIKGVPETVISRGKVVVSEGRVTGEAGHGRFVPRNR